MTAAHYEIQQASDDSFYFMLVAPNGEILETSETYTRREDAARGVEDAKHAAAEAEAS